MEVGSRSAVRPPIFSVDKLPALKPTADRFFFMCTVPLAVPTSSFHTDLRKQENIRKDVYLMASFLVSSSHVREYCWLFGEDYCEINTGQIDG